MSDTDPRELPSLEELVGTNLRRLRKRLGLTQEQIAQWMRDYGVKWTVSRVGEFEHGRLGLSLATFVQLANCLTNLGGSPVHLRDLLWGSGGVAISPNCGFDSAEDFAAFFAGAEVDYRIDSATPLQEAEGNDAPLTLSEQRASGGNELTCAGIGSRGKALRLSGGEL
jgi:transcriptional regulator with XRE-family HTH domain